MKNEFILRWLAEWGSDAWVHGLEVERVIETSTSGERIRAVENGWLSYKDIRVNNLGNTSHYKLTQKAIDKLKGNENG
jgi:hypothetical protein